MTSFLRALGPEHVGPIRARLALVLVVSALQGAVFALLVPVVAVLLGPDPAAVLPWVGALAGTTTVYAVLRALGLYANFSLGGSISRALHRRIGGHVVRLPLGWFTGARLGELNRTATSAVSQTMQVPVHIVPPLADAVVTPLVAVGVLAFYDWRLAAAAAVCAPLLWLAFRHGNAAVERNDAAVDAAGDEAAGRVLEYARAQPVLRAFGRVGTERSALDTALVAQHAAARRLLTRAVPAIVGFGFLVRLVFALLLVMAVYSALGGDLDAALLVGLLVLIARCIQPLGAAAELGAALRMARSGPDRINALLAVRPLPEPKTPADPPGSDIVFQDVSFAYGDGPDVLRDVSFTVAERSMTALVGPSGSGKTTVVRLLARFYDPTSGRITLGGADARAIGSDGVSERVAMVFQDVYLFDGSITDNIRVGRPGATDAEVARAATRAGLDPVLAELPKGADTRVGEGGVALSGGQKQRVSIARALLKDAPIIVLDEATAALDPENEAIVATAIGELARDRTLLVIAHRLGTVRNADQILFLDGRGIAERGTHDELLARDGRYADFLRSRERARGWRLTARPS
ncbi:ABC transporter ATP-binding protein [Nocardiopsis ansamitocini]|uniref:ABC transporter ATP-binding protein n=1 Tax=Nocardiopsis ansamitocini TaxID=1670832 RepID=A0A9W6PAY9_9ACTN|nr:ABC transporter ATP-binding protein [Nocardiopsis ansamitocini]GLU50197.1 ABC transporter ATP-binding protein [Nocardiopsis ansamitocini]